MLADSKARRAVEQQACDASRRDVGDEDDSMVEMCEGGGPGMGVVSEEHGTDFDGGVDVGPAGGELEGGVAVVEGVEAGAVGGNEMGAEGTPVGGEGVVLGGGGGAVVCVGVCSGRHSWRGASGVAGEGGATTQGGGGGRRRNEG